MLKVIVFIMCMLPVTAFGASYNVTGSGNCNFGPCNVSLAFDIDEADFGTEVRLYNTSGLNLINKNGMVVGTVDVGWYPHIGQNSDEPEFCNDNCAFATTSSSGNLLAFNFNTFNTFPDGAGTWSDTINFWRADSLVSYIPFFSGDGTWNISAVPIPAALPLFGAGLIGLGLFRKYKKTSS